MHERMRNAFESPYDNLITCFLDLFRVSFSLIPQRIDFGGRKVGQWRKVREIRRIHGVGEPGNISLLFFRFGARV